MNRQTAYKQEGRTANKVLPQWGLMYFYETFVLKQTVVLLLSFGAKNPPLRQYPNRYSQWYDDRANNEQTNKIQTIKLRQTILKSERHTDHTTNGQRVSQHSLPILCFLFFSQHTFFKNNFSQPHIGTFGFAPTAQADPLAKPKEPFFCSFTE